MDISVVPSTSTPAYRAIANDFLMKLFELKSISLEQLLQAGDFSFADTLLQTIQSQKEQLANGQVTEGLSPELQGQIQQEMQNANPQSMQMLQKAMA